MKHLAKVPVLYWREKVASPKLHTNKLVSVFALNIRQMNLTFDDESSRMEIESESNDSSRDKSELEPSLEDKFEVGVNTYHTTVKLELPDSNKLPLLYSLIYNPMYMD